MSLYFVLFNFITNSIYLFKGNYPKRIKINIFIRYFFLTILFPVNQMLKTKSITFLSFNMEGFEYGLLHYLYGEIFVRGVYFFKSDIEDPVIVDCGSNIGFSVLFFKFLYPKSRIYAFEPDPTTFKMLKINIKKNKLSNVILYNSALSDKEKIVPFYIGAVPGSVAMSTHKIYGLDRETKIKTVSFSEFLTRNTKKIDLIKMDIEGSEFIVLKDMVNKKLLQKFREIIIEYHHNFSKQNKTLGSFLSLLDQAGFSYQLDTLSIPLYQKNTYQGVLIYAYNKMFGK